MPIAMRTIVRPSASWRLGNEIARADRQHDERGRQIRGGEHMREAIREARIEDDREPVDRIGDAVAHLVTGRRLHPAVGGENPERRDRGAEGDDRRRERGEPWRHPVPAEQQHAEEGRLEEERGQHLVADRRADDVAGDDREAAPVGAELVGQHDARHDAHAERHREDLGPEARELLVAVRAAAQPHRQQRRNVGREPDGEAREDDVKRDRERELKAGEEDGIEVHRMHPGTGSHSA